jgi:hypothetical protein
MGRLLGLQLLLPRLRALQVGAKLNTLLIVDNNPSQQDDVKGVVFLEQKQNNRIGEARWRVPCSEAGKKADLSRRSGCSDRGQGGNLPPG